MRVTKTNNEKVITVILEGIAEQQVVYNALRDYYQKYKGENEYHRQLAEDMHDEYHEEYIKEINKNLENTKQILYFTKAD